MEIFQDFWSGLAVTGPLVHASNVGDSSYRSVSTVLWYDSWQKWTTKSFWLKRRCWGACKWFSDRSYRLANYGISVQWLARMQQCWTKYAHPHEQFCEACLPSLGQSWPLSDGLPYYFVPGTTLSQKPKYANTDLWLWAAGRYQSKSVEHSWKRFLRYYEVSVNRML